MKYTVQKTIAALLISTAFLSCDDDNDDPMPTDVVKEWNVMMNTQNEATIPLNRNDSGMAKIELLRDNTVRYSFNLVNLNANDTLTASHLHAGAPKANGPVILPLAVPVTGNSDSGTVANVRQSLVDSLKGTAQIYINVHSTKFPGGLVRGQLQ